MPQDDYSATSSGALKLKGVNSKVSKSHKKKRPKPLQPAESSDTTQHAETGQDKNSGDEILGDPSLKNKNSREVGGNDDRKEQEVNEEGLREDVAFRAVGKTEAERRHEERRRRRVCGIFPFAYICSTFEDTSTSS